MTENKTSAATEWDDWAATYDAEAGWMGDIHDADLAALLSPSGRRMLDIGCGPGRRAARAFAGAARITAVDFSEGMAAEARKALAGLPGAEVLRLDMDREEPPGEYDGAAAVFTMHHLRDPEGALRRAAARLAPGGVIVVVEALRGNTPAQLLRFYADMLRLHGPLRLGLAFFRSLAGGTRLARHKRAETDPDFAEFSRLYAAALPGARAERRHGIFGYLIWKKPA